MSLLVRINAAMSTVFIGAAFIAGYCCWSILEANARREVLDCAARYRAGGGLGG
jgi:hypothetical protein